MEHMLKASAAEGSLTAVNSLDIKLSKDDITGQQQEVPFVLDRFF